MRDPERLVQIGREWIEKADNDLLAAAHTLTLGEDCPCYTVCFHAQQCVEKYLKAFLAFESIDFPKTHDIERLIALSPARLKISLNAEQQRRLTQHATVLRYPGDYPSNSFTARPPAARLARRISEYLREKMTPAAPALKAAVVESKTSCGSVFF